MTLVPIRLIELSCFIEQGEAAGDQLHGLKCNLVERRSEVGKVRVERLANDCEPVVVNRWGRE